MNAPTPDVLFIESYFNHLIQHGIDYCIMRNAEEVEQGDAHDVDLVIRDTQLKLAEKILYNLAEQKNWNAHLQTGLSSDNYNIKCYNYYYISEKENKIFIVHIDIFPVFAWKGYEILPNYILLENINKKSIYHSMEPEVEAVCNLFVRLLYNGKVKDKYKPKISETFNGNKKRVVELMEYFLSLELANHIFEYAVKGEWDIIDNKCNQIRKCVRKKTKRKHFTYMKYLFSKARKRPGMVVAFLGPDGTGKTTIFNGLSSVIGNTFSDTTINYYHWRPGFIKSEKRLDADGNLINCAAPHTLSPHNKLISLGKLAFYTLDYILGYWFKIYWQAAQGHLVVFDRYYYDFYVDKLRYRLNVNDTVIKFFQLFIPQPDITFLLIGDAPIIHARKKEITEQEIRNQLNTLTNYQSQFKNSVIVNANQSIPSVLHQVGVNILKWLNSRIKKRH